MSGHLGVANSCGGMRRLAGKRRHDDAPLSRAEIKEFNSHLNGALHIDQSRRSLRHFSHFDSAISELSSLSPEESLQRAVVLLGEMSALGFRGVRPQLARLLVVLTQIARHDGYSLRVVAETAMHSL